MLQYRDQVVVLEMESLQLCKPSQSGDEFICSCSGQNRVCRSFGARWACQLSNEITANSSPECFCLAASAFPSSFDVFRFRCPCDGTLQLFGNLRDSTNLPGGALSSSSSSSSFSRHVTDYLMQVVASLK